MTIEQMKIKKIPKSGFYYEVACVLGEILNQHYDSLPVEIILQHYIKDSPLKLFIKSTNFIDAFLINKYNLRRNSYAWRNPFKNHSTVCDKLGCYKNSNELYEAGTDIRRCFDTEKYTEICKGRFWSWIKDWSNKRINKMGDKSNVKRELKILIEAGIVKRDQFIRLMSWKMIYYNCCPENCYDRDMKLVKCLGGEKLSKTNWYKDGFGCYTGKERKQLTSWQQNDYKYYDILDLHLNKHEPDLNFWRKECLIQYLNNNGITTGLKSLTKKKLIQRIMKID